MKNIRPFIYTTLFIFCLVVGFIVSKFVFIPTVFPSTPTPVPVPVLTAFMKQGIVLIIHVDQLSKPKPGLISVWALFMSLTDPSSLMVKSLYPAVLIDKTSPSLSDSFSLTSEGKPSPAFINQLKSINLHWDSYLILDNQGISVLANWITGRIPRLHAVNPNSNENIKTIIEEEENLVVDICNNLSVPVSQRGPSPQWKLLIPQNMRTDLYFDAAAVNWERLTLSNPPPHCEAISASN